MSRVFEGKHGAYSLEARIDGGGNGDVWRASGPNGQVALKILKRPRNAPPDAGPRFAREVMALEKLADIDGVLPLLDGPKDPHAAGQEWFVMPLATLLRKELGSEATLADICRACGDLAAALGSVHEKGIAHRDIKPNNLYWYNGRWCLGDFGLADVPEEAELTEDGRKLGPAFYIAPEMLNHAATADGTKADVYSLGKTLWVLATGQTYPMPGVHDPTYAGAAIATYCVDAKSALLDELVRRMTLLDAARRPRATEVAGELRLLAKDTSMDTPPDPTWSMNRLRAALVPHFTRRDEEARQSDLARAIAGSVGQAIEEIVAEIKTRTGLEPEYWYGAQEHWGYHAHMGGPGIESDDASGYSFEAGGDTDTWRLGIGSKHQLLSDGKIVLHVGYHFDYLVNGYDANHMGMPRGWEDQGTAPNGTPSAHELGTRLIAGLRENLPGILDRFAALVEEASK